MVTLEVGRRAHERSASEFDAYADRLECGFPDVRLPVPECRQLDALVTFDLINDAGTAYETPTYDEALDFLNDVVPHADPRCDDNEWVSDDDLALYDEYERLSDAAFAIRFAYWRGLIAFTRAAAAAERDRARRELFAQALAQLLGHPPVRAFANVSSVNDEIEQRETLQEQHAVTRSRWPRAPSPGQTHGSLSVAGAARLT